MSHPTPTRIPQPTRLLHSSSPSTKKSILSPKTWSSPKQTSVPKYQLQDPGVTPGSPKVIKRMPIRPPGSGGTKVTRSGMEEPNTRTTMNTEQETDITPTTKTVPSSSLWPKPRSSSETASIPSPGRRPHGNPIPPSTSASTTPTRIPIPRPRIIPNTRPTPTTSKTHTPPSPAISICATVATAPSTPAQRSSIPIPIPSSRSKISLPVSPAISIAATVATASPCLRDEVDLSRHGSEIESEVTCESIYSSASALALARYRASLPSLDNHELSRMSSTTSFSSASSLARHRISHPPSSTELISGGSIPMSTNTTNTEDMALVWQPDPESTGSDPAANLWMEIEARLNRGRAGVGEGEGMRDERGQWVLTRQRKCQVQDRQVAYQDDNCGDELRIDDGREEEQQDNCEEEEQEDDDENHIRSEEMTKQSSEFTISAYFDPDLSTPIAPSSSSRSSSSSPRSYVGSHFGAGAGLDMEGTAIFDMAAPLVSSISDSGSEGGISATPANTPLIHYETIQRVSRVRKSHSGSSSGSRSGSIRMTSISIESSSSTRITSDTSSAIVHLQPIIREHIPESIPMVYKSSSPSYDRYHEDGEGEDGQLMTRLDSHVQAVLEVLSDNPESPVSDNLDIDPKAQPSYLEEYQDGEDGTSPYIEIDESTPMPVPMPYHQTRTYSNPVKPDHAYRSEDSCSTSSTVEEVGLGIGMKLHLDSIYSLPVLSPRLVRGKTNHSSSTSECSGGYQSTDSSSVGPMSSDTDTSLSSRGESQDSYHYHHQDQDQDQTSRLHYTKDDEYRERMDQEEEEEMLTVTDLDTGHRVDLSIKCLDELWRI